MDWQKEAAFNSDSDKPRKKISYNDMDMDCNNLENSLSECETVDSKSDSGQEDNMDFDAESSDSEEESNDADMYQHSFLSADEIFQNMLDLIKEITSVTFIPTTITRIILNKLNWDKEKFLERLYNGDEEKLFAEAGVSNDNLKTCSDNLKITHSSGNEKKECQICFMLVPTIKLISLGCDHLFCNDCWREYLTTKIMQDGKVEIIECAAPSCDLLVSDALVMYIIKDSKVKFKFKQLISNNFIECNKFLRWCSSPNCCYIVKVNYPGVKLVNCKCGFKFCFGCGESFHEPVNCDFLKKWLKKCSDDSETMNWIKLNTKNCPKCDTLIEKNGGCNHMKCTRSSCEYHFCWLCLGNFVDYNHQCNKFETTEIESKSNIKAALEKYLFFYERYFNHQHSLKFENKIKDDVNKIIKEFIDSKKMTWLESQELNNSVDILCMCRQTLMYSYTFAYYLEENNQKLIFLENQNDFQNATEALSDYLEREITKDDSQNIKQKILDKCRYLESRRKVLIDHINEGVENNWWEYSK